MSPRRRMYWFLLAGIALLASLLVLGACTDDDGDGDGDGATPTSEATQPSESPEATIDVSAVPELEDGVLNIGSDIGYAPNEFYEEGTTNAMGMDVDLMKAIGDVLGVDVEFAQVGDFAAIVQDVLASRYDVVVSSISVTAERQAEINLIPYFGPVGTGVLVQTGNPKGIDAIEDLCGLKVAAQAGTFQVLQVEGSAEEEVVGLNQDVCSDNPITLSTFPDNPTAVLELGSGRVDAEIADDPVAAYSALQSNGELELAAVGFDAAPYGIGLRKDSTELQAVLEQALQRIMDNGTYLQILQTWGQEEFAYEQ